MNKRLLVISILMVMMLLVAGCSDDGPKPEERMTAFTEQWEKQDFAAMYEYVTQEAKEKISKKQFVERYENIYKGINADNVKVLYNAPEKLPKHEKDKPVELSFSVKMDTIAGPVEFNQTAKLSLEGKGENENWFIHWNTGFIFPELEEDEKVSVTTYPAVRGEIVDRYERGLAMNGTVAQVNLVIDQMVDREATVAKVASILHVTKAEIDEQLNQSWVQPNYLVPVKKLSPNDTAKISQLQAIPGVSVSDVDERIYPYGEATAHLIGYIGKVSSEDLKRLKGKGYTATDVVGKRGLEQILEERLRGEAGAKIYIKADNGTEKVIAEKKGKEGETITLTIDAQMQKSIYNQYKGEVGTAAAINPTTGEALALVSSPSFDPNQYVLGISRAQQQAYDNNPNQPLFNRFSAVYVPGSTMKPITGAVALKNGINPNKALEISGLTWKKSNWQDHSITRVANPGIPIDMEKGLIYSDNIYFARQALEIGKSNFTSGLKSFGFEEKIPFEYPITSSKIGDINSEGRLADSGYGQGQIEMSALHLALTYSTFINEGNMIAPTLFASNKQPSYWKENVISKEQAEKMKAMLTEVVSHPKGSAHSLADLKLGLAGKTGTAEMKAAKNAKGTENGWFVGMDTKNPSLIMAWMMEDVQGRGGSHVVVDKMKPVFKKYVK